MGAGAPYNKPARWSMAARATPPRPPPYRQRNERREGGNEGVGFIVSSVAPAPEGRKDVAQVVRPGNRDRVPSLLLLPSPVGAKEALSPLRGWEEGGRENPA